MIGLAVAIPSASLCINRRLYHIVSVESVTKTRAEKRRDVLVDLAIGVGIPVLEMILREYTRDHHLYCWLIVDHRLYCPGTPFQHRRGIRMLSRYLEHHPCISTCFRLANCYWTCLSFLLQFVLISWNSPNGSHFFSQYAQFGSYPFDEPNSKNSFLPTGI